MSLSSASDAFEGLADGTIAALGQPVEVRSSVAGALDPMTGVRVPLEQTISTRGTVGRTTTNLMEADQAVEEVTVTVRRDSLPFEADERCVVRLPGRDTTEQWRQVTAAMTVVDGIMVELTTRRKR